MATVKICPVGPLEANCYIVSSQGHAIVVDPGADPEVIMSELEGLTCDLIVLTHRHHDHVGAVSDLVFKTGAPVAAGLYDAKACCDPHQTLGVALTGSEKTAKKHVVSYIDKELIEFDKIIVGDMNFQVYETPGHTIGGISLYGEGMVFTGDTLFKGSMGRTDFDTGDPQAILNSLYKLAQLPDNTVVYPGHGPQTTIGDEKQSNQFMIYALTESEFARSERK